MEESMSKTRLNISLDQDLVDFIKVYVQENRTTVDETIKFVLLGPHDEAYDIKK